MRYILSILALALAFTRFALASDIMIMNAEAPASLSPAVRTGAVYLMLMNHGASNDKLVKVTTPAAETAEVHETIMDGDVMKMRPVDALEIPAGGSITLQPGAMHIMLVGLKAPLKEGDVVPLELTFEKAGVVKLDATVVKAAAGAAPAHDHSKMKNGG